MKDSKIEELEKKIRVKDGWLNHLIMIGFDYDGYKDADSLMKLIDELIEYAQCALNNDDTSIASVSYPNDNSNGSLCNILGEKIGEVDKDHNYIMSDGIVVDNKKKIDVMLEEAKKKQLSFDENGEIK